MRKTIIVYSPVGRIKARSKDVGRLKYIHCPHKNHSSHPKKNKKREFILEPF